MQKIVSVLGATGGQGGGVVSALLRHGDKYHIRGITRNANSAKAKALEAQGVEVVEADLNDEASLLRAFQGSSMIFSVTDFWETFGKSGPEVAVQVELTQGKNAATAAAKTPTLEHFVWSTLPNASKISNGKFVIPHFEAKNRVDEFIRSDPALLGKTTFLWGGYFYDNLEYPFFRPNKLESVGKYVWIQPVGPRTEIAHAGNQRVNIGRFVSAIFDQPERTRGGKFVFAQTGEVTTKGQMLEAWGRITGKQTAFVTVSLEDYDRLWPTWGAEMGMMLQFWEWAGLEKSWSADEEILSFKELGVDNLEGFEKALAKIEWNL